MKVEILKVKDGIIEPLGGNDMPACMCGCGGGGTWIGPPCAEVSFLVGQGCGGHCTVRHGDSAE